MKKKKWILTAIIAGVIGIVMYMMKPEPLIQDNHSGDFCPKCKSTDVGTFFYGLYWEPYEDSVTIQAVKDKRLIPGGCMIGPNSPKYQCNNCYYVWGKFEEDVKVVYE